MRLETEDIKQHRMIKNAHWPASASAKWTSRLLAFGSFLCGSKRQEYTIAWVRTPTGLPQSPVILLALVVSNVLIKWTSKEEGDKCDLGVKPKLQE
jgi:hypothetical protein